LQSHRKGWVAVLASPGLFPREILVVLTLNEVEWVRTSALASG
jgi:hypothetical protein